MINMDSRQRAQHTRLLLEVLKEWEALGNTPEELGVTLHDATLRVIRLDGAEVYDRMITARNRLFSLKRGKELWELEIGVLTWI